MHRRLGSRHGRVAVVAIAIAVFGACGSDGDDGGGSGGSSNSGACEAACKVCPDDPCADCATSSQRYRDEFENALFSCVSGGDACSQSLWIGCSQTANDQAARRPLDDDYRDACLAKKSACDAEGGESFSDDVCLLSNWYAESHVSQAQACLAKSCAEASNCLDALFD